MIDYVFWGIVFLFSATLIFYAVFFAFIYYWHETRVSYVIVPVIFTFDFFLPAFLVVTLVVIILQFLPDILKIFY